MRRGKYVIPQKRVEHLSHMYWESNLKEPPFGEKLEIPKELLMDHRNELVGASLGALNAQGPTEAQRASRLQDATHRVRALAQNLQVLRNRAEAINGRVFGVFPKDMPEKAGNTIAAVTPMMDELDLAINEISREMDLLAEQVDRIEGI